MAEQVKIRRFFCPLCGSVWEWHEGSAVYVSMIDVPLPKEIACPTCARGGRPIFKVQRPVFPQESN